MSDLSIQLDAVFELRRRLHDEFALLGANDAGEAPGTSTFDRWPAIGRAPGRLDVMGGIADYTGSQVCELPLACSAAVAARERGDRLVQVFSFNLYDEHRPFTLGIPLDALISQPASVLQREFAEPGREWAAYLAGCLHVLHHGGYVDLRDPTRKGVELAVLSTVPLGAGVSSSAAIEVATMAALVRLWRLPIHDEVGADQRPARSAALPLTPVRLASLCQQVENQIVGAPCGIMDQATSVAGRRGSLFRMLCQPHTVLDPLPIPPGMRLLGVHSGVRHSVGGGQYGRTRCAAFMGHKIILQTMRQIGAAAGRELLADPMSGYLANLDPDDYKRIFRPKLPERIKGGEFLLRYGGTVDTATKVEPDTVYEVVHATDHHVLEARRVRRFVEFLEQANAMGPAAVGSRDYGLTLDKAGHLMYASHQSYTMDAMLGCDETDLLVSLLRDREKQGIYGAKITGGGEGGTVAMLCEDTASANKAVEEVCEIYSSKTGRSATLLTGSSDGAWHELAR